VSGEAVHQPTNPKPAILPYVLFLVTVAITVTKNRTYGKIAGFG
jgi:hypothetical protein